MSTNSIKRSYYNPNYISNARKLNRVMIKSNALGVGTHLQVRNLGKEWAFEVGIVDGSSCGTGENSSGCLLFEVNFFFPFLIQSILFSFTNVDTRHVISVCHEIISAWLRFDLARSCLIPVVRDDHCRVKKEFVQTDSQNHALAFLACI